MNVRLRRLLSAAAETFWLLPAALVIAGIVLTLALVELDRSRLVPQWLVDSPWLYSGGGTGARTLLGAVASSTIGVAGTVFSITIASLSLAAGQMGPRLLRNFIHDRGNQFTLGALLGTFSYALMVLRSVRTQGEGTFIPHASLTVGILLAFLCVGALVFFVGHMAGRINVDTVIELVSDDLAHAIKRLTLAEAPSTAADSEWPDKPEVVSDRRQGYLQELDADALAGWAAARGCAVRLLVRPRDYVFPGAAIAQVDGACDGIDRAIVHTIALGRERSSRYDLEFAVRQLVEIAVRALSPGINDPHTAMGVLDRLGAALCRMTGSYLPDGRTLREGRVVLIVPRIDYAGLADAMFHMIRQNAAGSVAVLARMLDTLAAVAGVERDPKRLAELARHADLVLADAERDVANPADLADVRERRARFDAIAGR